MTTIEKQKPPPESCSQDSGGGFYATMRLYLLSNYKLCKIGAYGHAG